MQKRYKKFIITPFGNIVMGRRALQLKKRRIPVGPSYRVGSDRMASQINMVRRNERKKRRVRKTVK